MSFFPDESHTLGRVLNGLHKGFGSKKLMKSFAQTCEKAICAALLLAPGISGLHHVFFSRKELKQRFEPAKSRPACLS